MDDETINYLNKIYYDKNNINKTYKEIYDLVKSQGKNITQKSIKEYLKQQQINQIYKQDKRPKIFSSIVADKIRSEYQMDIMVFDRYEFHKYKYILVVVDIYSRYSNAMPMTNRKNTTIMTNIIKIFKEMGKPDIISCDNEFNTKEFQKYCVDNDIKVNFSIPNDIQKNSIVERLNRTLAGFIKKLRYLKIYDWATELPGIIKIYNNKYHRTIKDTPNNIFNENHKNKQDVIVVLNNLKVGDNVRIKLKRKIFDKGDLQYYSDDVYKIIKIDGRKYLLSDGKYYSAQNLKLSKNILKYDIPDNDDTKIVSTIKKYKNVNKFLRKEGIDKNNIIPEKEILYWDEPQ